MSLKSFVLFLVTGLLCCIEIFCSNPLSLQSEYDQFSIYLLNGQNITTEKAEKYELSDLQLQAQPWLSINDIEFYDFSTHCIYLKEDISSLFGGDSITIFNEIFGTPFVLVADGERCYLGSFYTSISSWMPKGPRIEDIDWWQYPKDVIRINRAAYFDGADFSTFEDVRNDNRIRNGLLKENKFHSGLSIQLNHFDVINKPDTSTIIYTFTITNNDNDNLYVPDPELMGSDLFHYYTNGINLENETCHIWSEYKTTKNPIPYDGWDINWFTRIKSKQSLQRTVILKGYPNIPNGSYSSYFMYTGPKKIGKDSRTLQDGRLWIGEIISNVVEINVKN